MAVSCGLAAHWSPHKKLTLVNRVLYWLDMCMESPRPFVKWAGGKRQLIAELKKRLPKEYNRYYEPFLGGGALFFALTPHHAYLADSNVELLNAYRVVRDKVEALISDLSRHENTQSYYIKLRDVDRSADYTFWNDVRKASRFIYLNKTCYNGLYRVNKKGHFNVPYGNNKSAVICDKENLRACSRALQQIELVCAEFTIAGAVAKAGDFIYFDPPYLPVSKTAKFTSYTKDGFSMKEQLVLRDMCNELHKKGVKFMLSSPASPTIYEIYKGYTIEEVSATRVINAKKESRGKVQEVIVRNYSS